MKKLCTTKDYEVLFYATEYDEPYLYGYDMLHDMKYIKVNISDIIEIDPQSNFIKKLISDPLIKFKIVKELDMDNYQQSEYLGVHLRTIFRAQKEIGFVRKKKMDTKCCVCGKFASLKLYSTIGSIEYTVCKRHYRALRPSIDNCETNRIVTALTNSHGQYIEFKP
jgi:hypothetical protein